MVKRLFYFVALHIVLIAALWASYAYPHSAFNAGRMRPVYAKCIMVLPGLRTCRLAGGDEVMICQSGQCLTPRERAESYGRGLEFDQLQYLEFLKNLYGYEDRR